MNDLTYILSDPVQTEACLPFSIVDTGTDLSLLLTLVDASTGAPPTSLNLISLAQNRTLSPVLLVQGTDVGQIGTYLLQVQAKFDNRLTYNVFSPQFTVYILHFCMRNVVQVVQV